MKRILLLAFAIFLTISVGAQQTNLSEYSYIVVPDQFDFLNEKDKFQLNSMSKFYFEKSGFNAYMADEAPNANRCDGLYANVEKLKSILGTKLQIVLKDCNNQEIYRSQEGKSKYKEYDKTYQDALRKAFNSVEMLGVNQKDVILIDDNRNTRIASNQKNQNTAQEELPISKVSRISGNLLPDAKFSNYTQDGKTFLLRKTTEGYALYEESSSADDGLLLKGKIIVMDEVVKYMDTSGKVWTAAFDASGNLSIKDDSTTSIYHSVN
ncbi:MULTISPECIES: hypothetical protein [Aequorivita]|uniref:Uncharacterized protein n=1 Tax=Aequorivita iocasae TaxID=2803865 RepID=A0ABX7DN21_9FLAO|nr:MULTISPECIES: hypothetical protein [Aequorivita]QQX75404.1 hypothetical protein JK629_08560 [Aequorivita iocasae]UCA54854.1 hypothetical protein LDL78_08605 [Aequorivita sp. F7]